MATGRIRPTSTRGQSHESLHLGREEGIKRYVFGRNRPDLAIVGRYVSRELIVFEGFGDAQMFAIKNGLNLTPTHVGWREVMYVCANGSLKSVYCPLEGRKV